LFEPWEWDWGLAKETLKLSLVYVGMISFNNICLRYVEVSMYQVARSLTIFWTIVFSRIYFPDKVITNEIKLSCLVVFIGFSLGSIGEEDLEIKGLIAGVISCIFVAYYNVLVKTTILVFQKNQWRLMIYNTTISIFLFIPPIIADGSLSKILFDEKYKVPEGIWTALVISGVVGILINIAIFMQINYTSPLTGSISGTVKACLQTILGIIIFQNYVSPLNGIGITITIIGSAWYSHIGYRESKNNELKNQVPSKVVEKV